MFTAYLVLAHTPVCRYGFLDNEVAMRDYLRQVKKNAFLDNHAAVIFFAYANDNDRAEKVNRLLGKFDITGTI